MRTLTLILLALFLAGCVGVWNESGISPPVALCSHLRATVGCPRGSVPCGTAVRKVGRAEGALMVKDWVFSGVSADVVDMALKRAMVDGGLEKVHYADYEQTSYLGFVTVFTLVAYGE